VFGERGSLISEVEAISIVLEGKRGREEMARAWKRAVVLMGMRVAYTLGPGGHRTMASAVR